MFKEYPVKHEILEQWFKEIVRGDKIDTFIETADQSGSDLPDGQWVTLKRYYFYTDRYKYCIVAKDRSKNDGYLGCMVSTRKARAGEKHNRGNDLPDGSFSRETWERIKNSIIKYELVQLSVKPNYQPDVEEKRERI